MKKTLKADQSIKLVMICSPGNPTGTVIPLADVQELLEFPDYKGIVVVDEAYIDFAAEGSSAASLVERYSNICVMQTLSKSFGLAAIRCVAHVHNNVTVLTRRSVGIALAHPAFIQILFNTKAPYNIATPSGLLALKALLPEGVAAMQEKCRILVTSRIALLESLAKAPFPELGVGASIGGNDANFVLIPILDKQTSAFCISIFLSLADIHPSGKPDSARALKIYKTLAEEKGVVVRYRGNELGCTGCLRITIGTAEENRTCLEQLETTLNTF